jgi:hypothetical protein
MGYLWSASVGQSMTAKIASKNGEEGVIMQRFYLSSPLGARSNEAHRRRAAIVSRWYHLVAMLI